MFHAIFSRVSNMFDGVDIFHNAVRAVARTLIGGGGVGVYSYIRVMPD